MYVIADSSLTIRRIVSRILLGLEVPIEQIVHAPTVADVARVLDNGVPTLLVTEWDLPGGDALDLVTRLRALSGGATAPVLLLSGRSLSAELERAAQAGVSDVVIRPFTPHLLREKLGQLLGKPVL